LRSVTFRERLHARGRIDPPQVVRESFDFREADLRPEEKLSVEVGILDDVEIDDAEVVDSRAHEEHRDVAADAACARYSYLHTVCQSLNRVL
jgi:hypothetical protein